MAKYCAHCGKQIGDKAIFCKYCGKKADFSDASDLASEDNANSRFNPREIYGIGANADDIISNEPNDTSDSESTSEKLPKKMIIIVAVALVLVLATVAIGAIMYFGKSNDDSTASTETTESAEEQAQDESGESQEQAIESKGSGSESRSSGNSKYKVGESYTVQTNLRVREGPGKNYRILDRSELAPDDYAKSVDSTTTTDALMEKGVKITCLEMSGDWMRISSGWVCVEDEGEVLVK